MKNVYLVEERTFDLENGKLMGEPGFNIYSSRKKAKIRLEEFTKRWLEIGKYKIVEEGLFPDEFKVIEDGTFRKVIRIKEDYVF